MINWKKTNTREFLPLANTLVNAISMPKKIPPIHERISPNVGAENKAEKLKPFPHNTNAPRTHTTEAMIEESDGFSLVRMNKTTGTAMQEKLSKKVFLAGVVESNPINWNK